jgi:GAF domain-containing protein
MDTARAIELLAVLLVVAGSAFMVAAITTGRRAAADIPPELSRRWRLITGLMLFFLIGYLLFAAILVLRVPIPGTFVAGAVFLGGAVFVYAVTDLTRRTMRRGKTAEEDLRQMNESLERQVAERMRGAERRTLQLQTTAEITRIAVQSTDPGPLMVQAVELIRERFGFYHASVFTLDETGAWAVLRASTGDAGRSLLSRNHRLAVGSASLVGWVTGNRLPRISNDVEADPFHFKNPLLPDTRAEMTLPLTVGGRLIGALDVQSTEKDAFAEEDVRTLEAIAGELAIAIDNARLVRETADELQRTEGLVHGRARESWARFARAGVPTMLRVGAEEGEFRSEHGIAQRAFETVGTAVGRRSRSGCAGDRAAKPSRRSPLADAAEEPWAKDDIELIQAAAVQVGLALESARQYAEEQRRVAELEVVNRVAQAVSQLLRLDSLFRVVHAQMSQVLPQTDLAIGLYDPATDQLAYPFWAE